MMKFVLQLTLLFSLMQMNSSWAQTYTSELQNDPNAPYLKDDSIIEPSTGKHTKIYQYGYIDRDHSLEENVKNIAIVYGLTWVFYPLIQPKVFKVHDGVNQYKNNFGKLVFDKDEPIWNFFVHPISGSQLFLLYRAEGYSRMSALGMATISSTLFEVTVEILTEPASVQDLYMTPILGTVLGLGIENLSMALLNSGSTFGKIVAHAINPATLLPLYEGRTLIIPKFDQEDKGAMMRLEFTY